MGKSKRDRVSGINYTAMRLYIQLTKDTDLKRLEAEGFLRGTQKGKTMNTSFEELVHSLRKQYVDWIKAEANGDVSEMKRTLADLRNVAGCVFLKLKEKTNSQRIEAEGRKK